jgi:hypothetical protein
LPSLDPSKRALSFRLACFDWFLSAFFGRSLISRPVLDDLDDARHLAMRGPE